MELDRAHTERPLERERAEHGATPELEGLITHEIRAPLEAMLAQAERGLASDASRQQESLLALRARANALLSSVDLVLDMVRIASGQLTLERAPFELDRALERVLEVLGPLVPDRELSLFVDPALPAQFLGDRGRLIQVLLNLASAAIAGATRPGPITLRAELAARESDALRVHFSVRTPRLLTERLEARGNTADEPRGAALGLGVSRELVQRMGGTFAAPEAGALGFELTLSLAAERTPLRDTLGELRDVRAMVVDEDEHARELLTRSLLGLGLAVCALGSATEAVAELHRAEQAHAPYTLAIAALRATGAGRELARALAHASLSPQLVLLSNKREHSMELAGARVVRTPLGRAGLVAILREAAGQRTRAKRRPSTPAPARAQPLEGISVLVVEDNEINQILARDLLETAGAQVTLAGDGQAAIRTTSERDFDLILMDVQMPGMDGHATTRVLRNQARTAGTPIIAMTAHAFDAERKKCLASGMNAHVSKPINPGELVQTVLTWARASAAASAQPVVSPPPAPSAGPGAPRPPADFDPNALGSVFRDPARQLSFLRKFVDSAHLTLTELHGAWQRRAEGDISFAGHKLKSSAKACGAHALATVCADLERHARDGDWDSLGPLEGRAEQLLAELTRYVEALEAAR